MLLCRLQLFVVCAVENRPKHKRSSVGQTFVPMLPWGSAMSKDVFVIGLFVAAKWPDVIFENPSFQTKRKHPRHGPLSENPIRNLCGRWRGVNSGSGAHGPATCGIPSLLPRSSSPGQPQSHKQQETAVLSKPPSPPATILAERGGREASRNKAK